MEMRKKKGDRLDSEICRNTIWRLATYSRLTVVLLQYIFNILIADHNAEGVFISPILRHEDTTAVGCVITHLLGGFLRWDAQYFLHIFKYGYTYENTLAFFPFYPYTVRLLTSYVPGNSVTVFLVAGVVLNNIIFIVTAVILFDLTLSMHRNAVFAYNSAVLFCLNPASIFFSAPYSESLFAFATFHGMYSILNDQICRASMFFGISAMTRSNGILNVGFFLYIMIHSAVKKNKIMLKGFLGLCFVLLCFSFFQIYSYYKYCISQEPIQDIDVIEFANKNNLLMPNNQTMLSWCGNRLAYSYVQDKYWNVGFLRYFQIKQIPNFILASPCIFVILNFGFKYFLNNVHALINLGKGKPEFPYIVHAVFLTIFCLFFIHVQVTTRMLASSSPVLYWASAYYFKFPIFLKRKLAFSCIFNDKNSSFIFLYFISYFLFGTILFVNFLPFT
ncbi:GPI mannosyltransferase 2 [Adelges cooleyi]|uniref:GPI mannosyltransferase 2 n=1 Tax=Adelges cooleyi TaxID=133065 RepID=UPI00218027DD|nr:GPI mannosyltransferase 2 [Adelges cooleyi]